jgi:hypothetical protein
VRELTFGGFLKQYVRALSLADTGNLYKLAAEAASANPRLREPLLLYALFSGKEKILLTATKSPELRGEYVDILERYDRQAMLQSLQSGESLLPERYERVYRSYFSVKNRSKNTAHTKALMRNRIMRLQREKNITNYRLYTDLRVNPGNMNAFIKHGNCSKVSLEIARRAITYLERL